MTMSLIGCYVTKELYVWHKGPVNQAFIIVCLLIVTIKGFTHYLLFYFIILAKHNRFHPIDLFFCAPYSTFCIVTEIDKFRIVIWC